MQRRVYRVLPDSQQWVVKHDGLILSRHYTKGAARAMAIASQPSQLVIHGADGKIATEWTYGDDPFPPSG